MKSKSPLAEMSDELLIKEYLASNDLEVIGVLYKRYTHLVLGLCMNYSSNSQEAEDSVMEIFESLFEKLKTAEVRNFKAWLYTVSRNHCLMKIRNEKIKKVELEPMERKNLPQFMESNENLHLNEEELEKERTLVIESISELNEEQRRCIELKYLEQKSYEEVAEITGFNLNQVKSFIQNGKRNMLNIVKRTKNE